MPRTESPPLEAAGRGWTLLAAASSLAALLPQLPARNGWLTALAALVVAALAWRRRFPLALRVLLTLGVVGMVLLQMQFRIGRDTGAALLAALIAIKPAELGSLRDARSLVGFSLFAPFAAFLLDQGPLTWALGLAAALAGLAAMAQLADAEARMPAAGSGWRHAWLPPLRLAIAGLPLALALFWLFPRIATPLWGVPERAQARPGLSDRMTPGEWLELMNDDTATLRVQFHGATPPTSQMYWRGPVLWNYDGRTWRQPQWMRGLPAAAIEPGPARWDYELEVEPTDREQLVALELPTQAPRDTQLSLDYGLYASRRLTGVTRWRMQSAAPRVFERDLKRTLRFAALQLPDGFNPRTLALARQWRAEAGGDDAAIVRRALAMIRAEFGYTLETPLAGRNAVDEFLFEQKAGFCEHFSSAFVVLMRAAGIPARVVTGYVGGYHNRVGDYWLVRRSDAHAWAEVWLPASGWTRVDPTAAVAPERIYDTLADRAPGTVGGFTGLVAAFEASDWLRRGWNDFVLGFNAERQRRMLQSFGLADADPRGLFALLAAAVALSLGWMLWRGLRGEHERDAVLRAWHGVVRRQARHGLTRAAHEPALAWARRIAVQASRGEELLALAQRVSDWRYAWPQDARAGRTLVRDLRAYRA